MPETFHFQHGIPVLHLGLLNLGPPGKIVEKGIADTETERVAPVAFELIREGPVHGIVRRVIRTVTAAKVHSRPVHRLCKAYALLRRTDARFLRRQIVAGCERDIEEFLQVVILGNDGYVFVPRRHELVLVPRVELQGLNKPALLSSASRSAVSTSSSACAVAACCWYRSEMGRDPTLTNSSIWARS